MTIASGVAARVVALCAAALAVSCADPALESCDDALSGLWRAPSGATFHITDEGGAVEVFERLDTVPAGQSASYIRLERHAGRLEGSRQVFSQEGRDLCRLRTPAHITRCRGESLVLARALPGAVDHARCSAEKVADLERLALTRLAPLP